MKRGLLISLMVGTCMAAGFFWTIRSAPLHAEIDNSIIVEPSTVLLGEVSPGAVKRAAFRIRNTGSTLYRIIGPESSCGCASIALPKSLKPGETATCELEFRSPSAAGPFRKVIRLLVQSEEPARKAVALDVKGECRQTASLVAFPRCVEIDPRSLSGHFFVYGPADAVELLPAQIEARGLEPVQVATAVIPGDPVSLLAVKRIEIEVGQDDAFRGTGSIVLTERNRSPLAEVKLVIARSN